jgi:hypothetical protein
MRDFFSRHRLPPEDQDHLFNGFGYLKGQRLSQAFSEPVIETQVLVDQEASHLHRLCNHEAAKTMPEETVGVPYS